MNNNKKQLLGGILGDRDNRGNGRKSQNDTEQKQDNVLGLGKECLDFVSADPSVYSAAPVSALTYLSARFPASESAYPKVSPCLSPQVSG